MVQVNTVRRLLLALPWLTACTIILDGGGDGDTPTPLPIPFQCDTSASAPKIHVMFAVRLERSTLNLAAQYNELMEQTVAGLAGAGFQVDQVSMLRLDERPSNPTLLAAWGCRLDDPRRLLASDVLRHYALEADRDAARTQCVSAPLVEMGSELANVVTQYPPQLPNGVSGRSAFGEAPDRVLIVHLDPLDRTIPIDGCAASPLMRGEEAFEDGGVSWLNYAGTNPRPEAITHWFLISDEGVDRPTFTADCSALEGFPVNVLDSMEASELPYYGALQESVEATGSQAASLSICRAMVSQERRDFLEQQITALAENAGLSVDQDRLGELLDGGLGALVDEVDGNDPP